MRYIGVTYSDPMMEAIQEDRKTQTRRLARLNKINQNPNDWEFDGSYADAHPHRKGNFFYGFTNKITRETSHIDCPYGMAGDIHYIKENFQIHDDGEDEAIIEAYIEAGLGDMFSHLTVSYGDGKKELCSLTVHEYERFMQWQHRYAKKSKLFMFRSLARTFLKVKSVRVERLLDISDNDAIAEGCSKYGPFGEYRGAPHPSGGAMRYRAYGKPKDAYKCVWEFVYGDGSWEHNPWVWVIEFEKIAKPESDD